MANFSTKVGPALFIFQSWILYNLWPAGLSLLYKLYLQGQYHENSVLRHFVLTQCAAEQFYMCTTYQSSDKNCLILKPEFLCTWHTRLQQKRLNNSDIVKNSSLIFFISLSVVFCETNFVNFIVVSFVDSNCKKDIAKLSKMDWYKKNIKNI